MTAANPACIARRDFLALASAFGAAAPFTAGTSQPQGLPFVQFMESLYVEGLDLTRKPDRGRDVEL
jgi:hypothetical protein